MVEVEEQLNLQWKQADSTSLNIDTSYLSNSAQTSDELTIPAYAAVPNKVYTIQFKASHQTKSLSYTDSVEVTYIQSPLVATILGGNRVAGQAQALEVVAKIQDPDEKDKSSGNLVISFTCISLNSNSACQDVSEKDLVLNTTESTQYFAAKSLEAYQSYNFKLTVTDKDGTRSSSDNVIIVIAELDLPSLTLDYPMRYTIEPINLNEQLKITLNVTSNPDDLLFSSIMIYNYDTLDPIIYKFSIFQFAIWNQISELGIKEELTLRISVYDPKYIMPSQAVINIQLNRPPSGGTMQVSPISGIAMQTEFQITFSGFVDTDEPITYQILVYLSEELYYEDVIYSTEYNQNVMIDYSTQRTFNVYLPSGAGSDNQLFILGRVSDALGGLHNVSQTIQVSPNSQLLESIIPDNTDTSYDFSLAIELNQTTCSNSANQTATKKTLYGKLNAKIDIITSHYLKQQTTKSMNLLALKGDIFQIVQDTSELTDRATNISSYLDQQKEEFESLGSQQFDEDVIGDQSIKRKLESIKSNMNSIAGILNGYAQQTNAFTSTEDQNSFNKNIMKIAENLANYSTTNQLPNSDPVKIIQDKIVIMGQVVTKETYSEYCNQFSSVIGNNEQFNITEESDEEEDLNIYQLSIAQFQINPFANDSEFPYQSQSITVNSLSLSIIGNSSVPTIKNVTKLNEISDPMNFKYNATNLLNSSENKTVSQLVCISQQTTGSWKEDSCKTVRDEQDNGEVNVYCKCTSLTPQTVVYDALSLFTDNELVSYTFSTAGLSALVNMNVFKFVIFYDTLYFTLAYICLMIWFHTAAKSTVKNIFLQSIQVQQEGNKNSIYPEEKLLTTLTVTPIPIQQKDNIQVTQQPSIVNENINNHQQSIMTSTLIIQPTTDTQLLNNDNQENNSNQDSNNQNLDSNSQPKNYQTTQNQLIPQSDNKEKEQSQQHTETIKLDNNQHNIEVQDLQINSDAQININTDSKRESNQNQNSLLEKQFSMQIQVNQQDQQVKIEKNDQLRKIYKEQSTLDSKGTRILNNQRKIIRKNTRNNSLSERFFIFNGKVIKIALMKNHPILDAIFNENGKLSRSVKLTLVYIKIIGLIALTSIFSQSMENGLAIFVTVVVALFLGIPIATLKMIFSKKGKIRVVGTVISVMIIILCWYMILTVAALLGEDKSNTWAL